MKNKAKLLNLINIILYVALSLHINIYFLHYVHFVFVFLNLLFLIKKEVYINNKRFNTAIFCFNIALILLSVLENYVTTTILFASFENYFIIIIAQGLFLLYHLINIKIYYKKQRK